MPEVVSSNGDRQAPDGSGAARLFGIVCALGIAQIISWGSLYYSLAVLARPIGEALALPEVAIFGAFTLGLLVSGMLAPAAGRWVDRRGGRDLMALGSLLAALAFGLMATAQGKAQYFAGWIIAGIAMAACLYEPAFASLHQMMPNHYRRAVTGLTLFGGFASTVFWPLSSILAHHWGWREALLSFAVLHLVVCLPLHAWLLPARRQDRREAARIARPEARAARGQRDARHRWLAASFAASAFAFGALAAFMISALASRGFTPAEAAWIAAAIGPMQVLGRTIDWLVAERLSAIRLGFVACGALLLAMLLINVSSPTLMMGLAFAMTYGAANGLMTIVRGTAPAQLFGAEAQGTLLGTLARPTFIAKALAPGAFAALASAGMPMDEGLALLALVAVLAFTCYAMASRGRSDDAAPRAAPERPMSGTTAPPMSERSRQSPRSPACSRVAG